MSEIKLEKNWKCRLGFHDYEIIKRIYVDQLKEDILSELENRLPSQIESGSCSKRIHKICLRCGKEVDTINMETYIILINENKRKDRCRKVELIQNLNKNK